MRGATAFDPGRLTSNITRQGQFVLHHAARLADTAATGPASRATSCKTRYWILRAIARWVVAAHPRIKRTACFVTTLVRTRIVCIKQVCIKQVCIKQVCIKQVCIKQECSAASCIRPRGARNAAHGTFATGC